MVSYCIVFCWTEVQEQWYFISLYVHQVSVSKPHVWVESWAPGVWVHVTKEESRSELSPYRWVKSKEEPQIRDTLHAPLFSGLSIHSVEEACSLPMPFHFIGWTVVLNTMLWSRNSNMVTLDELIPKVQALRLCWGWNEHMNEISSNLFIGNSQPTAYTQWICERIENWRLKGDYLYYIYCISNLNMKIHYIFVNEKVGFSLFWISPVNLNLILGIKIRKVMCHWV